MTITFQQVKDIVREIVEQIAFSEGTDYYILNQIPIEEMAKLNLHDTGAVPFPYNKFDIRIWSNDHNPPHFHVIDKETGWEITINIETGQLISTKRVGNSSNIYRYILKNIPIWLKMKSLENKSMTNQENAMTIWNKNHKENE